MNQIIKDFNARLAYLGCTKQELADKICKEISTVTKQLDPKVSNPQLSTLVQYAEALGGELHFVTPESLKAMQDADVSSFRERLNEMGTEITYLKQRVAYLERLTAEKDAKIGELEDEIADRNRIIARKEEIIDEKDKTIARKDAKLSQLIDRMLENK